MKAREIVDGKNFTGTGSASIHYAMEQKFYAVIDMAVYEMEIPSISEMLKEVGCLEDLRNDDDETADDLLAIALADTIGGKCLKALYDDDETSTATRFLDGCNVNITLIDDWQNIIK